MIDYLIVGAGFAGATCARVLADAGKRVKVIDKRSHIAGNAYDCFDDHGVLIHQYGPHIFHTNSQKVFEFLSRFTDWREYEHRVLAKVKDKLLPIPINQTTINNLYGLDLDEKGVAEFFERVREPRDPVRTSEDAVLNSVGRELCDTFFSGYTRKQWGLELSDLSASVAARIPVRTNKDDRYFTDRFQTMPEDGYTAMFQRMLDHENIEVMLGMDFLTVRERFDGVKKIFTGPIDEYFGCCYGKLPYRSLRFEHQHFPGVETSQITGTINYPNDHDFTRVTEFKHLTGQSHAGTSVVREYSSADGDPYYPIPNPAHEELFKRYQELAEKDNQTIFVGRLAQYRYYNMDQVVAAALHVCESLILN